MLYQLSVSTIMLHNKQSQCLSKEIYRSAGSFCSSGLRLAELSLACPASAGGSAEGWVVWDGLGRATQFCFTWSVVLQRPSLLLFSGQRWESSSENKQGLLRTGTSSTAFYGPKQVTRTVLIQDLGKYLPQLDERSCKVPLQRAWVWKMGATSSVSLRRWSICYPNKFFLKKDSDQCTSAIIVSILYTSCSTEEKV